VQLLGLFIETCVMLMTTAMLTFRENGSNVSEIPFLTASRDLHRQQQSMKSYNF